MGDEPAMRQWAAELVGPSDDREMVGGRCGLRGLRAELAAVVINSDDSVGALVRIDPEHDHGSCCLSRVER